MCETTDMVGQVFGRLTVTRAFTLPRGRVPARCECLCACGTTTTVPGKSLRRGTTNSCGCLCRDRTRAALTRHAACATPEYKTWTGVLRRCRNPNDISFRNYGARGITVAPEWLSFAQFLLDMGHKPSPAHSIDRIDNDAGYTKWNCRWATRQDQCRNRRNNKLTLESATQIRQRRLHGERPVDLAREFSVSESLICRIASGRAWADDEYLRPTDAPNYFAR